MRKSSNYISVLLSIVLIATTSCSTTNPVRHEIAVPIEWGMTRSALEQSLGGAGQHQFRAIYEDQIYDCVSYRIIEKYYKYYFILKENSLASIHTANKFWVISSNNPDDLRRTWSTRDRIEEIITTPTLGIDSFLCQIDRLYRESKRKKPKSLGSNIWPIAIAAVPFYPLAGLSQANLKRKEHKWRSKFDPKKVELGMTESEVIEKLGAPIFKMVDRELKTLSFGPKSTISKGSLEGFWLGPLRVKRFWVSVSFESNKVVGIHSDDLFNMREILRTENYIE